MTKESNNQLKNIQRSPFVSLCYYASKNNWCWKIYCTTCGHSAFKVSFSKIVHGQHPDDESFWPYGKENHELLKEIKDYNYFFRDVSVSTQIELASIAVEAKLFDIQAVAKFPDWLGYIGLVLQHCPDFNARKILSDAFLPQFIALVKNNKEVYDHLQVKQFQQKLLDINDLSRIESSIF